MVDRIVPRGSNDVPPELKVACDAIDEILQPLTAMVEMSALTTLLCRNAVAYGVEKDTFIAAVSQGYDVFIRRFQQENTVQ